MKPDPQLTIPSKPLPHGWLVVALLCVVGLLNYLDRIMITTMRESITDALPMTEAQFGLLTSVFLWVYGLLSPFAGFLADRFARSRVIIASLLVWSVVTWLTAHASTFEELLATRALMGISEACYIPASLALIADYHRGSTRSLAMGIHLGGIMAGQSLGFLGGWIAEEHSWNDAFRIFGIVGIAYSLVLVFFLRDPNTKKQVDTAELPASKVSFFEGIKSLFTLRSFILLFIFWGLLGMVGWMILGWLPTYYQEHFDLTQAMAGLYATGYLYPISLAGALLGGYFADRWVRTNYRSRILVPVIGLCIAAPAVFFASSTGILYVAIICFMIYALTRIFSDVNLMPILCMVADKRYRATGYGVLNMFASIIGGLGIYAGGILRDANIDLAIMFKIAALCLVVCVVLLLMIKTRKNVEE